MPEPITETTQTTPATTTTTEQGTVGAPTTPAPSQTSTEVVIPPVTTVPPVTTQPPQKLTSEEVQRRIDRMYARLQEERKQRLAAEVQLNLRTPPTTTEEEEEGEPTTKAITEADVEAIVERKERGQKLISSEIRVFERHPNALNEDGSFNMNDLFVQKYIEIGRINPALGTMENGPELAEAMVDKMLGVDYKKGRKDEATRVPSATDSFTTSSTITSPPTSGTPQLSSVEQKIARRMHMTDKEYNDYKASNKVIQKSWEVKAK